MSDRRKLIVSLTAVAAVIVTRAQARAQGVAVPPMAGMAAGTMTAQTCIESCWRCHVACLETERYCLEKGGPHAAAAHLALMAGCAEICVTAADSMLRRSSQHGAVCLACAQVCDACAQACETFPGDERMASCARSCRDCATHCREMSKLPI